MFWSNPNGSVYAAACILLLFGFIVPYAHFSETIHPSDVLAMLIIATAGIFSYYRVVFAAVSSFSALAMSGFARASCSRVWGLLLISWRQLNGIATQK